MIKWKDFVKPEILFLLGTLQALSPYVLWYFLGSNASYHYEITYLPIIIWTVGYIFFWLGTKVIRINPSVQSKLFIKLSLGSTKLAILGTIALVIVQIVQAVRLYGILPIYGYITGSANVLEVNEIQRESGFGQLGSLTASLFLLNGILLILFIKGFEAKNKPKLFFFLASCVEIFGSLVAGKRQGLLIFITFLLCGLSIQFGNPLKPILKFFALPSNRVVRTVIYSSVIGALVLLIGFLSSLRMGTGSEVSGIDEILNYLQYPLINLEAQCEEIGLGPYKYNLLYPLLTLLPFKAYETIAPPLNELPFRPEPTIGAGFYGSIHWGMGLVGIVFYAFIFGMISKFFYKKSSTSLFHLLVYCQISWTLLSAHTYNHFFTLIFLPIPTILFFVFCLLFNRTNSHEETASHETNQSLPVKS
jgi:oligosaccharide repeat unit polymerase